MTCREPSVVAANLFSDRFAMAFIIVADSKSDEIDRRELAGPLVIGRSPECDMPVRDILLSRKHCIIERIGDVWVVADLNSKNGTRVNGDPITQLRLTMETWLPSWG